MKRPASTSAATLQPLVGLPLPLGPRFAPGELLAGRWRIERLIARGGMGEVYEAFDQALGERVALKTLRAATAADGAAAEQFKREIQLARRVTHPNVCRIFDLGLHQAEGVDTLFLTMELLDGETLTQRLDREGPLATSVALPLLEQMAAGLEAAHRSGIVHRDFKCANVMLVPAAGGLRVVVTDFGIAHSPEAGPDGEGSTLGSPAYMAPEQVLGERTTPASDVYALGVVLFEVVTGHWPFEGEDAIQVARRRLTEAPRSPRELEPSLDPLWEQVILRCLARQPADRYPSVREVAQALAGAAPPVARRSRLVPVAAAVALAALGALGTWWWLRPVEPPGLAVLGFRGGGGRGDALREAVTAALGGEGLWLAPASDVERAKLDLGLSDADTYAPDTLEKAMRRLGVERVVSGSVEDAGDGLVAEVAVQGARRLRETSPDLPGLALQVAAAVQRELGQGPLSPAAEERARARLASRPEALEPYVEGLRSLRRGDLVRAREALTQAARTDPACAPAQAALVELWAALGRPEQVRETARVALALPLDRQEQARVAAALAVASGEWDRAIALRRGLHEGRRDAETGLDLLRVQAAAGRAADARATLAALRLLPAPDRDDPHLDLEEARLSWLDDPERARAAVQRAMQAAERRGARSLLADAQAVRAQAAWLQGDLAQASEGAEAARVLHAALGQQKALADDLNVLLAVRWQQGKLAEAAAFTEENVAIQRRLGSDGEAAANLANLGFIRVRQGRLAEARACFLEASRLRDPAEPWQGVPELGLAWIDALRGERVEARRAYAAALERLKGFEEPYPRGFLLLRQAELAGEQGDVDAARKGIVAVREEMARNGLRALVAEARLAEAALLLRAGQVAEAEGLAQGARDDLRRMEARAGEAVAQSLLAEAAARRGAREAASAARSEAERLLTTTDDRLAALTVGVQSGRAACAAGESRAVEALRQTSREAAQAGFRTLEMEAAGAAATCGRDDTPRRP